MWVLNWRDFFNHYCLLSCVLVYFGVVFCPKLTKEATLHVSLKRDNGETKYNLTTVQFLQFHKQGKKIISEPIKREAVSKI